jgi:hypothetical protein
MRDGWKYGHPLLTAFGKFWKEGMVRKS